jgi:hypothetical protein
VPALHHVEHWAADLAQARAEREWLLGEVGWIEDEPVRGSAGRSWSHPDGTNLYVESGPRRGRAPHDLCARSATWR